MRRCLRLIVVPKARGQGLPPVLWIWAMLFYEHSPHTLLNFGAATGHPAHLAHLSGKETNESAEQDSARDEKERSNPG